MPIQVMMDTALATHARRILHLTGALLTRIAGTALQLKPCHLYELVFMDWVGVAIDTERTSK